MTQAPPAESTTAAAEQLWLRAHEFIRRGNLAQAVRDLAKSFEILKALKDPRVRQVHAKWVEVHKLYTEEQKAGAARPVAQEQPVATLQAEAEAAANAGRLDVAIATYQRIVASQPGNELARERLTELTNERARKAAPVVAQPVVAQPVVAQPVVAQPVVAQPVVAQPAPSAPVDPVAFLEGLLTRIQENRRPAA